MTFNLGAQVITIRETLRDLPSEYSRLITPLLDRAIALSGIDILLFEERARQGQEAFSQEIVSRPNATNQKVAQLIDQVEKVLDRLPTVGEPISFEVKEIAPETPFSIKAVVLRPTEASSLISLDRVWTYRDRFERSGNSFYAPFSIDFGESFTLSDVTENESLGKERSKVNLLRLQLYVFKEGLEMVSSPVNKGGVGTRYIVKSFDTLIILSQRFYNTPDRWREIAEVNGLEYPYTLYSGQVIFIPTQRE